MNQPRLLISIVLSLFLFGANYSYCQAPVRPGIYKTFDEFRQNRPSEEFTYGLIEVQWEYETGNDVTLYKIDANMDLLKSLGKVIGFATQEAFFLNQAKSLLATENQFFKTEKIGKYLYFEEIEQVPVMNGSNIKIISYFYSKVFDTRTGEIMTLTPKIIKSIISSNPALLRSFEAEPNPDAKLKEYLLKFYTKPTTSK